MGINTISETILNYVEFGSGKSSKKNSILFAHGLFGSKKNWLNTAKLVSEKLDRHVIVVDLRNHGSSFWSNIHDYTSLAGDLIKLTDHLGSNFDLIGHSMGGKAVMSACLVSPQKFDKVVVIDIAPVSYPNKEFVSYISGMKRLDLTKISSRNQADCLLATTVPDQNIRNFLLQNIVCKENGNYEWVVNLDSLENNIEQIGTFPLYEAQYLGAIMFIKGQKSPYLTKNTFIEVKKYFPSSIIEEIENAGHWPHIDQPKSFQDKLIGFLDTTHF